MELAVLMENTACSGKFLAEHGLSLYLESGGRRILFDMGQSDGFAVNAQRLGIDLAQVDFAVLSHGHYDHGGGLERFLEINRHAKVYVSCHAFGKHYNREGRYIGLNPALAQSRRLVPVAGDLELGGGMMLISGADLQCGATYGLQRMEQGQLVPEDFRHEQYLLIQEGERKYCISGCSHKGILGIAAHFQPDVLVGGFHFMKEDPHGQRLADAARTLCQYKTLYYTGHCTGQEQFECMKPLMGQQLHRFCAGMRLFI